MKTKEQILDWLDRQPWKGEFYENVFKLGSADKISYDCCFISHAFPWCATQGGKVWVERNTDFRSWYDSNDKPMSWEEYCAQNPTTKDDWFVTSYCTLSAVGDRARDAKYDANVMSKDLCEAFLAYMKLIQLRNAWVKDGDENLYRIVWSPNRGFWCVWGGHDGLSFSTEAIAKEFIKTFQNLLEVAKPLI